MPEMQLIYYILLALFVLVSTVLAIIQFVKSRKDKSVNNTTQAGNEPVKGDNQSLLGFILDNVPKYMVAAEQLYNSLVPNGLQKTGAQKLADVLQKIKIDCLTNGIVFDEKVEETVVKKVEELIDLTKNVNSKK